MPPHNQEAHDRYNSEPHPARPFGSALGGKHAGHSERPSLITVRPIRPRGSGNNGRCAVCGDRYFGCGHDGEEE